MRIIFFTYRRPSKTKRKELDTVPPPAIPSLKDTLLAREGKHQRSLARALVQSSTADDRAFLEAIKRDAESKLVELESAPNEAV